MRGMHCKSRLGHNKCVTRGTEGHFQPSETKWSKSWHHLGGRVLQANENGLSSLIKNIVSVTICPIIRLVLESFFQANPHLDPIQANYPPFPWSVLWVTFCWMFSPVCGQMLLQTDPQCSMMLCCVQIQVFSGRVLWEVMKQSRKSDDELGCSSVRIPAVFGSDPVSSGFQSVGAPAAVCFC